MRISVVQENSEAFNHVIELWQSCRNRLGFFPLGAFEESAARKQILGAIDDDTGELLGYLLFRLSRDKIAIVHLRSAHPGLGISEGLVDALVDRFRSANFTAISLSCRRDYELEGFWQKLGFAPIGEKLGRGKDRAVLTIWSRPLEGQDDLFQWARQQREDDRLRVTMDANVFFRLSDEDESDQLDEASVVIEDWLAPLIDVGFTDELLVEINRAEDPNLRKRRLVDLSRFMEFHADRKEVQNLENRLRSTWKALTSDRDKSDLRHVAKASAAADVFVTMDEAILSYAEEIEAITGLRVMRPAALASSLDSTERHDVYAPIRLGGTVLAHRATTDVDVDSLVGAFHRPAFGEKKSQFRAKIRALLGRRNRVQVESVDAGESAFALSAISRSSPERWSIELLRAGYGDEGLAAAGGLIARVLQEARYQTNELEISEECLEARVATLLEMAGFVQTETGKWFKPIARGVVRLEDVFDQIEALRHRNVSFPRSLRDLLASPDSSRRSPSPDDIGEIERCFGPFELMIEEFAHFSFRSGTTGR